jgi:hypothetical protein
MQAASAESLDGIRKEKHREDQNYSWAHTAYLMRGRIGNKTSNHIRLVTTTFFLARGAASTPLTSAIFGTGLKRN